MPLLHDHRRARLAAALALAVCALAGCAGPAPTHERPPLPVPEAYPADTPSAPSSADAAAALGWRDYFADPQLRSLIELALANNRDLRIAQLRVREARAAWGIQRAQRVPTVALAVDASRARVPGDLNLTARPIVESQYEVGLAAATWELDFWGRVRDLQDAALQDYLATDEGRRAATLALISQVANQYLALRELDERVALARRTIASRRESLRIFTRRFEVGSTSKLDLAQVQTLAAQAESLGAALEQARAAQAHALSQLLGATIDLPPDAQPLDDDAVLPDLRPGLPSALLEDRPDILAAERRLRAAHAQVAAARAAFFPTVTLTGEFGTASASLDGLFGGGSRAWSFAPTLSLPIFDGGRRQAGLDLAQVRREVAVADYEKTVQQAFRDVCDALSARRWLADQVRIQRDALAAQAERARLATLRYDDGAAAFLEVLEAQRDLLDAQQQLVQTRRALLGARVELYAALGGGSQRVARDEADSPTTPIPATP